MNWWCRFVTVGIVVTVVVAVTVEAGDEGLVILKSTGVILGGYVTVSLVLPLSLQIIIYKKKEKHAK